MLQLYMLQLYMLQLYMLQLYMLTPLQQPDHRPQIDTDTGPGVSAHLGLTPSSRNSNRKIGVPATLSF